MSALKKYYIRIEKILFFLFCIVFYWLFQRDKLLLTSLNIDEIYTWALSGSSWKVFFDSLLEDTQLPLYFILMKLWQYFPHTDNDYYLRLPSVVITAVALFIGAYYFMKKYTTDLLVLFVYFILFMFMPLIGYAGIMVRPYALLMLGAVWVITLVDVFFKNEGTEQRFFSLKLICATAALLWSHSLGLVFLFSILASLILIKGTGWVRRISFSGKIVLLGIVLLNIVENYLKLSKLGLISWANNTQIYNLQSAVESVVPLAAWGTLIAMVFFTMKYLSSWLKFLCLSLVVYFALLSLFSIKVSSLFVPRYWLLVSVLFLFITTELAVVFRSRIIFTLGCIFIISQAAISPIKWPHGYKEALKTFKNEYHITENDSWSCISYDKADFYLPSGYFKMYWGRDLCSEKLDIKKYLQVKETNPKQKIFIDKESMTFETLKEVQRIMSSYHQVYSSSVFDLYDIH